MIFTSIGAAFGAVVNVITSSKPRVFGAVLGSFLSVTSATAATIGAFDGYRTYGNSVLGGEYDAFRANMTARGHGFAGGVHKLTPGRLNGVDLFITGWSPATALTRMRPQTGEADVARQWVMDGGVFVITSDAGNRTGLGANSWAGVFGFNFYAGTPTFGGNWSTGTSPFLGNGVAGSSLAFHDGVAVNANSTARDLDGTLLAPETFATATYGTGTYNAVMGAAYGDGYVLLFGDTNPLRDTGGLNPSSAQFIANVIDASDLPAVPLPAGLPLLMGGLMMLGFTSSKRKGPGLLS